VVKESYRRECLVLKLILIPGGRILTYI
jgi:hypothetical protein